MKLPRRRFLHLAAGAAASPAVLRRAHAQSYPAKPVHLLVGFAPGGGNDIAARLIGHWLSERLGQQFIVENRPGAGSNIATEAVVRAAPDGYTLLLVAVANATNATLYDKLNFNFIRDIAPVAGLLRVPNLVEVHPSVPARTLPEFIAYAKANPGKVNMGSGGSGGPVHMTGELFNMMAGLKMQHVPYRGEAPALNDLIGGQVDVVFGSVPASIQYVRAGKLRALAVTTSTRSELLPDLPTVAEFVPGYEFQHLVRHRCAQEHARRDRRSVEPRDQRLPRRSDAEGKDGRSRRHGDRRLSRGFQRAHRSGHREVGQSGEVREHQAGVIRLDAQCVARYRSRAADGGDADQMICSIRKHENENGRTRSCAGSRSSC